MTIAQPTAAEWAADRYAKAVTLYGHDTHALALEAFKTSLVAHTAIEQHEKICSQRWKVVVMTNFTLVATALAILGVLLQDKFF